MVWTDAKINLEGLVYFMSTATLIKKKEKKTVPECQMLGTLDEEWTYLSAMPFFLVYVKLILESDEKINKNMTPSCSFQTCWIYLLYREYMPQFYFSASAFDF